MKDSACRIGGNGVWRPEYARPDTKFAGNPRNAARFVEPLDVDALAKSIIEMLEDKNQRELLVATGPTHAGEFSWEKTARLTWMSTTNSLAGLRRA